MLNESQEKLLKELLQKKLNGTITDDENLMLGNLSAMKHGRSIPGEKSPEFPPSGMMNLMNDIDSLNSTMKEMTHKVNTKASEAEAKHSLAERILGIFKKK